MSLDASLAAAAVIFLSHSSEWCKKVRKLEHDYSAHQHIEKLWSVLMWSDRVPVGSVNFFKHTHTHTHTYHVTPEQ